MLDFGYITLNRTHRHAMSSHNNRNPKAQPKENASSICLKIVKAELEKINLNSSKKKITSSVHTRSSAKNDTHTFDNKMVRTSYYSSEMMQTL